MQRALWEVWKAVKEHMPVGSEVAEPDPLVEAALTGVLLSAPARAADKLMGEHEGATQTFVLQVGAAIFSLGCWLWAAFLSTVEFMLLQSGYLKSYRAVLVVLKLRYDETPSRVRVSTTIEEDQHKLLSKSEANSQEACTHAKIMQVEHTQAVLLQRACDKSFVWYTAELPTRLVAMDRTTGENTRAVLFDQVSAVPELLRILQPFDMAIRVSTCDRYSANLSAEIGLQQDGFLDGFVNVLFPCDVHKLHTCIRNANHCCDEDVSGLIHCGLTAGEVGATKTMRAILISILNDCLEIEHTQPPTIESDVFRQQIFDLHLPLHGVTRAQKKMNEKRRFVLAYFLNSHLDSERIVHHCVRNCCLHEEATRQLCAQYLVWSLLPHTMPTLSKKTWTGYNHVLSWVGILDGHHFLFQRMMEVYIGKPKAPVALPAESQPLQRAAGGEDAWFESIMDDERVRSGSASEEELALGAAALPDAEAAAENGPHEGQPDKLDWKALKRQSRMSAKRFISTSPGARITVLKQSLAPVFVLMDIFLRLGGVSWKRKQERLAFKSEPRTYVILEAALGADVNMCLNSLLSQLGHEIKAVQPQNMCWTLRALRFKLVACAATSIHSLLRVPRGGMPYQLFRALRGEVRQILDCSPCMRDSLCELFLKKYTTAGALRSPECQTVLEGLAVMFDLDIAAIESKHSQTRSYCLTNSKGWRPSLESVSSKFLCRYAKLARGKRSKPFKKRRRRRGGGGAWRAFVHERCSGKKFDRSIIGTLSAEYAALTDAEKQRYTLAGSGATLAHKSGYPAFAAKATSAPKAGTLINGSVVAADGPLSVPGEPSMLAMASIASEMLPYQGNTFPERYGSLKAALACTSKSDHEATKIKEQELQSYHEDIQPAMTQEVESANPVLARGQFHRMPMQTSGATGLQWFPPVAEGIQVGVTQQQIEFTTLFFVNQQFFLQRSVDYSHPYA